MSRERAADECSSLSEAYSPGETTVVLLAAGHGKRMLPLTAKVPKPLLMVGQHSLIEHHLLNLRRQGFNKIVINLAYRGDQIRDTLGDGKKFSLSISYSDESGSGALETAGGLRKALPLISSDPFVVVNADIWTDFDFLQLLKPLDEGAHGRLIMVPNPAHNPDGDFGLETDNTLSIEKGLFSTFSGIALYRKKMFQSLDIRKQPLRPIFQSLIAQSKLTGLRYDGDWADVGTPQRLEELNQRVSVT